MMAYERDMDCFIAFINNIGVFISPDLTVAAVGIIGAGRLLESFCFPFFGGFDIL